MVFDEVSLVRRPANQHAAIVFSKAADEGDDMPGVLYAEDGTEINIDDLEVGTEIELDDGEVYVVVDSSEGAGDEPPGDQSEYGKADEPVDYAAMITKAYAEAVDDDARKDVISKMARATAAAQAKAEAATARIEKMASDSYVEACISKAAEYGFAGDRTEELGVLISKAMTVLDPDEIQLLDDIFKAFSTLIDETAIGTEAVGPSEVMDTVKAYASTLVEKSGGELSPDDAFLAAFEADPSLYQTYLDEKGAH